MLALFFFHFVMIGWIWCTRISLFIKCLGASQIFTFFLTPKCQHQKTRNIEIKFWLNRTKIKVLTGFLGQFRLLQHNWRNYVENFMKIVVWIRFLKYLFLVVSIWWTVRHMCVICCFESFGGKFKRRNIYDLDNSVVSLFGGPVVHRQKNPPNLSWMGCACACWLPSPKRLVFSPNIY